MLFMHAMLLMHAVLFILYLFQPPGYTGDIELVEQ